MVGSFARVLITAGLLVATASAAPLPWHSPQAQDALRFLSESGVLGESWLQYRAATRWEVAVVVQRLLQKQEQEPNLFATRAEREALTRLITETREELQALGVRVTTLEERTSVSFRQACLAR